MPPPGVVNFSLGLLDVVDGPVTFTTINNVSSGGLVLDRITSTGCCFTNLQGPAASAFTKAEVILTLGGQDVGTNTEELPTTVEYFEGLADPNNVLLVLTFTDAFSPHTLVPYRGPIADIQLIETVPLPAGVWLLFSGLGVLGWFQV